MRRWVIPPVQFYNTLHLEGKHLHHYTNHDGPSRHHGGPSHRDDPHDDGGVRGGDGVHGGGDVHGDGGRDDDDGGGHGDDVHHGALPWLEGFGHQLVGHLLLLLP